MLVHYSKRCFVVEWVRVMCTPEKKMYQIIWISKAVLNDSFSSHIILLSTYVMVSIIHTSQPLGILLPQSLGWAHLMKIISVSRNSRPKGPDFVRLGNAQYMCPLKNGPSSQTFWCNKYRTCVCTSAAYTQLQCQHSVFPFAGPLLVTAVSPDSSCLSSRNNAAASRIRLNSMQKAWTSINSSCKWINCMLIWNDCILHLFANSDIMYSCHLVAPLNQCDTIYEKAFSTCFTLQDVVSWFVIILLLCTSVNHDLHHLVTVYYSEPWHVSSCCCVLLQTMTSYYCAIFQTTTFSI